MIVSSHLCCRFLGISEIKRTVISCSWFCGSIFGSFFFFGRPFLRRLSGPTLPFMSAIVVAIVVIIGGGSGSRDNGGSGGGGSFDSISYRLDYVHSIPLLLSPLPLPLPLTHYHCY